MGKKGYVLIENLYNIAYWFFFQQYILVVCNIFITIMEKLIGINLP